MLFLVMSFEISEHRLSVEDVRSYECFSRGSIGRHPPVEAHFSRQLPLDYVFEGVKSDIFDSFKITFCFFSLQCPIYQKSLSHQKFLLRSWRDCSVNKNACCINVRA